MINISSKINDSIAFNHLKKLIEIRSRDKSRYYKNLPLIIFEYIENLNGLNPHLDLQFKIFLSNILDLIIVDDLNRNLITAKPEKLSVLIRLIEYKFKNLLDSNYSNNDYTYRKLLSKIFYYDNYDRWDAYELASQLKVNICPYCNRIPTYTIGKSLRKGTRPQFDHFFDKSRYPYLSLSIYNLVPSCNICNSSYKHSKEFNIKDHYHPYLKCFDCENIKFTLEIENIDDLLSVVDTSLKIPKYEIGFKSDSHKNVPKNILDLGLKELYNYDKSYTDDIIKKSFIYNKDYIDSLYKEWEGSLFGSKEEIKNLVMGNYLNIDDINKRPLGKLTKDITEELGIF